MCGVIDSGQKHTLYNTEFRNAFLGGGRWIRQKEITVDYSHPRGPTTGLATLRIRAIKTFTVEAREKV